MKFSCLNFRAGLEWPSGIAKKLGAAVTEVPAR